jgi:GNAT superfamily N-acetyltransferase
MSRSRPVTVRRELQPGDVGAIVRLHGLLYRREHRLGTRFETDLARSVAEAVDLGWPDRGGIWIVEHNGELAGSLALTEEEPATGRVRWFLLAPQLRGAGLGRRLLGELLSEADDAGYDLVWLDTFSDLRAAAQLYRSSGFELTESHTSSAWGRPLVMQYYERRRP